MCEHSMCEHDVWALYVWAPLKHHHKNTTTPKATSVLGPDVADNRKVRELPRKQQQKHQDKTTILQNTEKYEFSGRMLAASQKHHDETTILQNTEK